MKWMSAIRIAKLLQIPKEKAQQVMEIIRGKRSPDTYPSVKQWLHECPFLPDEAERRMHAINELLEGNGVETIECERVFVDDYYRHVVALYVDREENYEPTILYGTAKDKYLITPWREWVEREGY